MQWDKDVTEGSNLNSKYLSVTFVVIYPDYLFCFYCVQ